MPVAVRAGCFVLLSALAVVGRAQDPTTRPTAQSPSAPSSLDGSAVADLRALVGPRAQIATTAHFVLIHAVAAEEAAALGPRLEAVYAANLRLAERLGVPIRAPFHKLPVIYFAAREPFEEYIWPATRTEEDSYGGFEPDTNRAVFFKFDLRGLGEGRDSATRQRMVQNAERLQLQIMQHEVAHQVQFNVGLLSNFDRTPAWLREGLACMCEASLDADGTRGAGNPLRLLELRRQRADNPALVNELRDLLTRDEAWRGAASYALAWAAVQFYADQRPHELGAMVILINGGAWPRDAAAREALLARLGGSLDADCAAAVVAHVLSAPATAPTTSAAGQTSPAAR